MLNSAATAFVSETSIFPDEQNIATFEELYFLTLIMIFYCVIYRKTALQPLNKLQTHKGQRRKRKN